MIKRRLTFLPIKGINHVISCRQGDRVTCPLARDLERKRWGEMITRFTQVRAK